MSVPEERRGVCHVCAAAIIPNPLRFVIYLFFLCLNSATQHLAASFLAWVPCQEKEFAESKGGVEGTGQ